MRLTYRPFNQICRQMASQSKVTNNSKGTKGSPKKTSADKASPPIAASVAYEPQIDDGSYKAPEYYGHNTWTFADHMISLSQLRLPQPSNKA